MHSRIVAAHLALVALLCPIAAVFAEQLTYSDADSIEAQSKERDGYSDYLGEFLNFNNYYHIDERSGCYEIEGDSATIIMIITDDLVISSVLTDRDSEKARCWQRTYEGIRVKPPPFTPFVIKMKMGT